MIYTVRAAKTVLRLILVINSLTCAFARRDSFPRFVDYPSKVVPGIPTRNPQFLSNDIFPDADPRFRDEAERQLRKGINFAGHFTIVVSSCGSGCKVMGVADVLTGKVFHNSAFGTIAIGPFESSTRGKVVFGGLKFVPTSRLLVAEGCFDVTTGHAGGYCSKNYYLWEKHTLLLIKKIALD